MDTTPPDTTTLHPAGRADHCHKSPKGRLAVQVVPMAGPPAQGQRGGAAAKPNHKTSIWSHNARHNKSGQ